MQLIFLCEHQFIYTYLIARIILRVLALSYVDTLHAFQNFINCNDIFLPFRNESHFDEL